MKNCNEIEKLCFVLSLLMSVVPSRADSENAPAPGTPLAWGNGFGGQLGDGIFHTASPFGVSSAGAVQGLNSVLALAGGGSHTLALRSDGTVWQWGAYGHFLALNTAVPVQVPGITTAIRVEAGDVHSLALLADGTVRAWGFGGDGELGNGSTASQNSPVQVSGLSGIVAISGGGAHSLALRSDGTVWAWGSNTRSGTACGQLGDGTSIDRTTPVQVGGASPLTGVIAVSAGFLHSLALKADGTVWAWGYGGWGQLGNGLFINANPNPFQVPGLSSVTAIAAGWEHSLVLKSDGTVWAFGRDMEGQIGNGTFVLGGSGSIPIPTKVSTLTGVVRIAGGQFHSLALTSDHSVWGWGRGDFGQLDNNHFFNSSENFGSSVPVRASTIPAASAIAAGYSHSLAVRIDNSVPVPRCTDVTVSADPDCMANVSINNGSSDPDEGDLIAVSQTPPGPYPLGTTSVTLTVTDSHNLSASCTANVTVVDTTPPSLNCPLGTTAQADANCTAPVPDVLGGVTASDCNGPVTLTQAPAAGTMVGLGAHTIIVTGTDRAGNRNTCNTIFTVADATKPVVTLAGLPTLKVECHTAFMDPGATATDNCGAILPVDATGSVDANIPGSYILTYSANDPSGNMGSATRAVLVVDTTRPEVVLNGAANVIVECHSTFIDPGAVAVDSCAGSLPVTASGTLDMESPGIYIINYSAVDPSGNVGTASRTIQVTDTTAPAVSLNGSATLVLDCAATFLDPGASAIDACAGPLPTAVSGALNLSTPGSYPLVYTATDPAGNVGTAVRTIVVANSAPHIESLKGPGSPVALKTSAGVTLTFNDAENSQEHSIVLTWDDGTSDNFTTAAGIGSVTRSHTYAATGVYTVAASVSDPCGLTVNSTYQFVVVYNPYGGFVTGGGTINSPPGAYRPSPNLAGKATFGFNSKYAKGATVPDGTTRFQFHVADFTFNSTSYEWLVVAGSKAQYKGAGTVNGVSGYSFLLTASDGDLLGGNNADKFRIKITSANGDVTYDNSQGNSDDLDLANPPQIAGGSIVIHKE